MEIGFLYTLVRLLMRTLVWLIVLFANCGVFAAFAPSMFEGDIVGFVASILFAAIGVLLVAARIKRLPSWGTLQ